MGLEDSLSKCSSFVNSVSPNGNSNRYVNPATTESLERTGLLFRAMKMTMSGCLKRIYYDDGINVTRDSIGNIVSICTIARAE